MKIYVHPKICTWMFIAVFFARTPTGNNPDVPQWVNGWTKYGPSTCGIVLSLKKKELSMVTTNQMSLQEIMFGGGGWGANIKRLLSDSIHIAFPSPWNVSPPLFSLLAPFHHLGFGLNVTSSWKPSLISSKAAPSTVLAHFAFFIALKAIYNYSCISWFAYLFLQSALLYSNPLKGRDHLNSAS